MSFTAELGTMGSFKKDASARCNPFQLAKCYNRTANTGSLRCDWTLWANFVPLLSIYFVQGAYRCECNRKIIGFSLTRIWNHEINDKDGPRGREHSSAYVFDGHYRVQEET